MSPKGRIEMSESVEDINPNKDGIEHINVHSEGRTIVGRMLDNLAYMPFDHPQFGQFNSIEGFYWWYISGQKHEYLRYVYNDKARKAAAEFKREKNLGEMDKEQFRIAVQCKIAQSPFLQEQLQICYLPLVAYTVYGKSLLRRKLVPNKNAELLLQFLDEYRDYLQGR